MVPTDNPDRDQRRLAADRPIVPDFLVANIYHQIPIGLSNRCLRTLLTVHPASANPADCPRS